jgi:hypothetical protein
VDRGSAPKAPLSALLLTVTYQTVNASIKGAEMDKFEDPGLRASRLLLKKWQWKPLFTGAFGAAGSVLEKIDSES